MCHWFAAIGLASRNQAAQFGRANSAPSGERAAPESAGFFSTSWDEPFLLDQRLHHTPAALELLVHVGDHTLIHLGWEHRGRCV